MKYSVSLRAAAKQSAVSIRVNKAYTSSEAYRPNMQFALTVASVSIDIKMRVVDFIEAIAC